MHVDPDQLYWGDNGICLCGKHLGYTACMTGKDLHGTRIEKVTLRDIVEWKQEFGEGPMCESHQCSSMVQNSEGTYDRVPV